MNVQAGLPEFDSVANLLRKQATQGLGMNGSFGINNEIDEKTPESGRKWTIIQVLNDTVFETLNGNIEGKPPTGVTIPAGTLIWGQFTSVKLTSGVVLCYYDFAPNIPA